MRFFGSLISTVVAPIVVLDFLRTSLRFSWWFVVDPTRSVVYCRRQTEEDSRQSVSSACSALSLLSSPDQRLPLCVFLPSVHLNQPFSVYHTCFCFATLLYNRNSFKLIVSRELCILLSCTFKIPAANTFFHPLPSVFASGH